ncbi:MAG: iron-containing alcohol dehydrogenase [SAR324 cluster bacterium]|nr:iron-containing alcohol dehydrogenase [SAR324 cluster bacterium]
MYSFEQRRATYQDEVKQFPLHMIGGFNGAEAVGWGAVKVTGDHCKQAGINHALLVTTGLRGTGIVDEVRSICTAAGVETTVFKVGQSNPREEDVHGGMKAYQDSGADGFLSVGGGSSHDTTKAIRLMLANPGIIMTEKAAKLDPNFVETVMSLTPCAVPHVAVNTTTGTGAEMTGFCVVTDWENHWKYVLVSLNMVPAVGILDPALLRTMPERIAAQTGIDCFVHSIGGFVSRLGNQLAKACGMRGAKLCWENLAEFSYSRQNDKACENMAWAQYLGAMTYAMGGGLGMIHGLAHQISAMNDMHHGLANALTMVPVCRKNFKAAIDPFAELAQNAFNIDTRSMTRFQAAEASVDAIEYLRNIVGIDDEACKLGNYGLTEKDFKLMAKNSINDLCNEGSAKDWTEDDSFQTYMEML